MRMSVFEEVVAASRAVLHAAEETLLEASIELPSRRYVSVQEGDWVPGHDIDVCDQLVVVPFSTATRFNSPLNAAGGGGDPSQLAVVQLVDFRIIYGGCVNLDLLDGRLAPGDVDRPWDDPQNENTHWSESIPVIAARWAFARRLAYHATQQIAAQGFICRQSFVSSSEPWLEGGCAGTAVTLQVQM